MTNSAEMPDSQDWRAQVGELVAQGWDYLEFLTGVDWPEDGAMEIVVGLRRVGEEPVLRLLSLRLDRRDPVVDSLVTILPGAAWYERETHEMFGVRFVENEDLTPLLLAPSTQTPLLQNSKGDWPLRRTTPLPARLKRRWPGLSDPSDNPPAGLSGSDGAGSTRTRSRHRTTAIPGNCGQWES